VLNTGMGGVIVKHKANRCGYKINEHRINQPKISECEIEWDQNTSAGIENTRVEWDRGCEC
jgi:hypothetical protein